MKAKELRIGNFVNYIEKIYVGQKDKVVKIIAITENYLKDDTNKNTIIGEVEAYKPIPLTEEWFLKFGFVKDKDGLFKLFEYSEVPILFSKDLDCWTCDGINFSVNNLNHVHQLQNLYFALTGEELKTI